MALLNIAFASSNFGTCNGLSPKLEEEQTLLVKAYSFQFKGDASHFYYLVLMVYLHEYPASIHKIYTKIRIIYLDQFASIINEYPSHNIKFS